MGRLNFILKIALIGTLSGVSAKICDVKAQEVNQKLMLTVPEETLSLIVNAEVFLSGQTLYYSVATNTPALEVTVSSIAYVELIADTKNVVFKQKVLMDGGHVSKGDYFLPTSLKTGHYKLIAYTQWSLNNKQEAYIQKDLYIINPYFNAEENNLKSDFSKEEPYVEISQIAVHDNPDEDQSAGIGIRTDLEKYKTRNRVTLSIENNIKDGFNDNYSVIVKRIDFLKIEKHNTKSTTPKNKLATRNLPEMRGELIQGTVRDVKMEQPVENQPISLSIPGEREVYKSTTTDKNGEFFFNLYEPYEQDKGIIQVVTDSPNEFQVVIKPKGFDRYEELEFSSVKLDSNLNVFITQNSIYNQVESAYYNLKRDSILQLKPANSFYGKPDNLYVLDDFTRFKTVKETFIEVVQQAAIRKQGDKYQFLVYDFNLPFGSTFQSIKPLLLFDGVQVQDESIVIDFNPQEIRSVAVVQGVYSIGSNIYNGIIDIKLKKPSSFKLKSSSANFLDIEKTVVKKDYFKQSYNTESNDRIPDFRTQLLWLPNVKIESNSTKFDFYTSDVPGVYKVELIGTSQNGNLIRSSKTFLVED